MSTTLPSLTCTFKPNNKPKPTQNPSKTKPTDRVIDFGKHTGKMLGTLPSTYLKWVSNNLRAGDTKPWATLADQVLQDPVYQDRVEWEFAQTVMTGSKKNGLSFTGNKNDGNGAVLELVEISERFGWDNEDKVGWSKVDFEFLGTSQSGRIPRLSSKSGSGEVINLESNSCDGGADGLKVAEEGGGDKRRERRQRRVGEVREGRMEILKNVKGSLGEEVDDRDLTVQINSTFPGRDTLLKKVLNVKNSNRPSS